MRIGCDIGNWQDFSAVIATEQEMRLDLPHYLVRSIECLPLGTPYPAVPDRIEAIMGKLEARGTPRLGPRRFTVELSLDATGVGLPIGDMLRERDLDPRLVLFTGSDKVNQLPQGVVTVGKCWMVGRLQVLLQSQRLHLPRTVAAGQLTKEPMDYQINVNQRAHASFDAKSGSHDDLIISLGLSCGIDRTGSRVESRNYLAPGGETIEDALRDRWARCCKKGP